MPKQAEFAPVGAAPDPENSVVMTVDEYECIRFIDYEGFTQEECAACMNIARTTVQSIYDGARRKLSVAIVEGKALAICGGEYKLCVNRGPRCLSGNCGCAPHRFRDAKRRQNEERESQL